MGTNQKMDNGLQDAARDGKPKKEICEKVGVFIHRVAVVSRVRYFFKYRISTKNYGEFLRERYLSGNSGERN